MKLSNRETWSQQVMATRLAADGGRVAGGFWTFEKRTMLLQALKTAMAAGICYWIATLAHLQDGYWGSISAIIVLQSNVGSTVTASRDRLIGTLIGAGFGAVFSLLGTDIWMYLLAVVTAMVVCSLLGLKNSSRLAGVTVTILMLVHRTGSNWTLPLHRVLEVLLGIVVALLISTLVLPDRARSRLRDGLAQEYLRIGALFELILQSFRGEPPVLLSQMWKEAVASVDGNALLLDAARNEPSGGQPSLEVLSLLHQFGRESTDLLRALELATHGSHADNYAARLEPELGRLAGDIHQGFQALAACIHHGNFAEETGEIPLEDDVAALDAKMASIRPSGLEFEQAEILRAYAVQLHLKQLAQLLWSSRAEIGRIAGA